jgi:hypothetical protein
MEDETDGACGNYRGEEKCVQNFGVENWLKETTWKSYTLVGG